MSNHYKRLHKQSYYATICYCRQKPYYVTLRVGFRQLFFFFGTGISLSGGLTICKKYAKFFVQSAVTKTRFSGKIPREDAIWCEAFGPLPERIPLPSRVCGNATPGTPVKASMSGSVFRATRVEPWNTAYYVSHP